MYLLLRKKVDYFSYEYILPRLLLAVMLIVPIRSDPAMEVLSLITILFVHFILGSYICRLILQDVVNVLFSRKRYLNYEQTWILTSHDGLYCRVFYVIQALKGV